MVDAIANIAFAALLCGVLWFMFTGMRSKHGPAKSLRGLNRYGDPPPWGATVLTALACVTLARFSDSTWRWPAFEWTCLWTAVIIGVLCGLFGGKKWLQGTCDFVCGTATIAALLAWVAEARSGSLATSVVAVCLFLIMVIAWLVRPGRRSHEYRPIGFPMFAATDVTIFLASSVGESLFPTLDFWARATLGLLLAVVLAFMPWSVLMLAAVGVAFADLYLSFVLGGGDEVRQEWFVVQLLTVTGALLAQLLGRFFSAPFRSGGIFG